MVAVKIGRYQMDKKDHNPNLIPKTKDLESILLNFTLAALITISPILRNVNRK